MSGRDRQVPGGLGPGEISRRRTLPRDRPGQVSSGSGAGWRPAVPPELPEQQSGQTLLEPVEYRC